MRTRPGERKRSACIPGGPSLASRGRQIDGHGAAPPRGHEGARRDAEVLLAARGPSESERVLATVMFTDIVGSTELAGRLGDARWRELLLSHDAIVREEVARARGRVVKSLGDGALAVFDGPSRAIGASLALTGRLSRQLGLTVRSGLHTGECELLPGEDVGGFAVHIGARIASLAAPGEVLVSGTVRDLAIGSPFRLESRGERRLKGVEETWRVFSATAGVNGRPTG
jgi:class 3 adenylate cyclase